MFEDFSQYTEQDPNGRIDVTPDRVTFTGISRNEDAFVYTDKAGYFSGDFTHKAAFKLIAAENASLCLIWGMANQVDDFYGILMGLDTGIFVRIGKWWTGESGLWLFEVYNGSYYYSGKVTISLNVPYWITIVRDESTGNGTFYCYVYTDEERTNLLGTAVLGLHEKADFQYLFALNTWNDGNSGYLGTGYVENLALGTIVIPAARRTLIMDTSRRPLSFDTSRKDLVLDTKRRTLHA